jgi:hypothetical protein
MLSRVLMMLHQVFIDCMYPLLRCYPAVWQLDESMGTHLVNTSVLSPTPDGAQIQGGAGTAQQCADQCAGSPSCIGSTWIYSDTLSWSATNYAGQCIFYIANPTNGHTLYVKVLPLDYLSAASSGRAAVSSGAYVKYNSVSPNLGVTISNTTAAGVKPCKNACDALGHCWGFYYNGFCVLRTGFEAEGHRTFMHVLGEQVE